MADLRIDYQDDILDTSVNTKRKYNMINNADGTVSFEDVSVYTQEGDTFGAVDINQATTAINNNTNALNGIKLSYNTSDGHFYAQKGSTTKKLGSGEGTAITSQVLDGITFTSEEYEDIETGTMVDNQGKTIIASVITNSKLNLTVKIPQRACYDTNSKLTVPQNIIGNVLDLGTGTSFDIKTILPNNYSQLTASNFIVETSSANASTDSADGGSKGNKADCNYIFSKSYNSLSGIFTCNANVSASGARYVPEWSSYASNFSISQNVICHVYLVLGKII